MNIYAIRDRLIDYFMQPFMGPDDKNVQASVARLINQGEITSDIAQAPHHFEIWKLGHVTEDGHLVPERALVQDCASLIRRDLRGHRLGQGPEPQEAASAPGAPDSGHAGNGRANPRPVQIAAPGAPGTPPAHGGAAPGGD